MKAREIQFKIMIIIFVALFLFFLCGDFKIPAVKETAVITAVGVGKAENGEFELVFLLAGTNENGERENKLVETSAPTVAGGVEMLKSGYGLTPKLAYTSLVLVEKELASGEIFDVISFFLNTSGVHDSAKLMIADGKVGDIFSADIKSEKAGLGGISKVLGTAEKKPIAISQINLKDFAEIYFSKGVDASLACVKLQTIGEQTVFDVSEAYLYHGDEIMDKINGDTVLAYNILKGKGQGGSFTISDVALEDCISDLRLAVANVSCKVDKTLQLGVPKINVAVKMKVGLLDQNNSSKTLPQIAGVGADKEIIARAVEKFIKENIEILLEKSFSTNADFLGIGEELLVRYKKEFEAEEGYLGNAFAKVEVLVEVLQNHRL